MAEDIPPTDPDSRPDNPDPEARSAPVTDEDRSMTRSLDEFLDELAAGHRQKMEEVVAWLTEGGHLEDEIRKSVGALSILLHKWSIEIGFLLRMHGTLRFNEIKSWLEGIGSRTLSQRLKDLEAQGIVHRKVYPEVPVRVEYSLSESGKRMADLLLPVIAHLRIEGERRRAAMERAGDEGEESVAPA